MAKQQVTAGSAPLVWSTVSDAFDKINANFSELYITAGGGEPFDFTQITTSLIPAANAEHDLGSGSKRWKTGFFSRFGISIGGALIASEDGLTLNLPSGTKVDGELIRNPDESSFKTFAVAGQNDVVANNFTGTVTLANGTGINLTTDSASDTISITNSGVTQAISGTGLSVSSATGAVTFNNTGVTSLAAGSGITVSTATGSITVSNSGVLSVVTDVGSGIGVDVSVAGVVRISNLLPSTLINAFRLISVSGEVNVTAQNSADTLTLIKSTGIDISTNLDNEITFINTGVTALATTGQALSVNAAAGSVTVNFNNRIDIIGSVFADDSTLLVDAVSGSIPYGVLSGAPTIPADVGDLTDTGNLLVGGDGVVEGSIYKINIAGADSTLLVDSDNGMIVGDVATARLRTAETKIALGLTAGSTAQGAQAVAVGNQAGQTSQGNTAVAIGSEAGKSLQGAQAVAIGYQTASVNQGGNAVAIGQSAGLTNQGTHAVAIGTDAGKTSQGNNSIIINATGAILNQTTANTFTVKPIRNAIGDYFLQYDPSTGEITYNNTLTTISADIIGSVFADDSTILVNASDGSFSYIPTTPGDWDGTAPTTVGEAIDRLATLVKALNSGTGA